MNLLKTEILMVRLLLVLIIFTSCKVKSVNNYNVKKEDSIGVFTNLGVQLRSANLQASAFVQDDNGKEYAYTIVRGRPGHLVGYDMQTNKVIADIALATAEGAIDMVSSTDNWLYIGASNGKLYRTRPGSQQIEDLGTALAGTAEILDMIPGKDGEIFGGTYPTGKIFRYHPEIGFSDVAGQIVKDENYVRSISYHSETGKLFAGVGSHAHLIEVDPKTKSKKEILPQKYHHREFVYYMGIAEGVDGGDRLLAWVTDTRDREILVYNLRTGEIEQVMETLDAYAVVKSKTSNEVYFTTNNKLYKNDLTKIGQKSVFIANCNQAKQIRWGKDGLLHIITRYAEIKRYNPATGEMSSAKMEVSPQPYGIQTLIAGPDGKIWSSGFLHGGNAAYDPKTGKSTMYNGLGQAEGMVSHGNNIYFGVYPKARIYTYDVTKTWEEAAKNPKQVANIDEQDRPFATASLPDKNLVYFGTVSGYGKLGGALAEYNVHNNKIENFTNVVKDHSIVSLLYHNGIVWGGTTIFGGLGVKPTQKEGKVFAWDVNKKQKVAEFIPVEETMAITSLVLGPKGKIWGLADGVIFVFDPSTKKIEKTKKLFEVDKNTTHIWRIGFLHLHPNGQMYGTANGEFFSINPKNMEVKVLKKGVGLLALDKEGTFYTRDSENLWSYKP
jgi:WD40 repeat protein